MVRNTMKRAEEKASEIQEMEVQLDKSFYCGSCSIGFQTIEVAFLVLFEIITDFELKFLSISVFRLYSLDTDL